MNLFIKKVLFLFSCATLVLGESLELQSQECPKNKVFHGFRGCPVKCGEGPFGNEDCKFEGQLPGCYCPEGFAILKSDGECVPYSQCPCGENEFFDGCSAHCKQYCDDPHATLPCTTICLPGCKCKKGYAVFDKSQDGKCTKFEECPGYQTNCTKPNENYRKCWHDCGLTCENPSYENAKCDFDACQQGCFCEYPYLRDTKSGECFSRAKCELDFESRRAEKPSTE